MKGFKSKLLLTLVMYFAGFATAIYALAPVDRCSSESQNTVFSSFTKSDEFALKCSSQLRKIACLAEDTARKTSDFIGSKMAVNNFMSGNITGANRVASNGVSGQ